MCHEYDENTNDLLVTVAKWYMEILRKEDVGKFLSKSALLSKVSFANDE